MLQGDREESMMLQFGRLLNIGMRLCHPFATSHGTHSVSAGDDAQCVCAISSIPLFRIHALRTTRAITSLCSHRRPQSDHSVMRSNKERISMFAR